MRKLFTLLILLFFWAGSSWAQVSTYSFASTSGTYTPITGGTLLRDGTLTMDSWVSTAQTIPSFTFNGVAYTTAYVTSNGLLTLGGSAPSSTSYTGISSTTGSGIALCPFNADLDRATTTATTEIRWETIGNEIIFQWQQIKRYGSTNTESFDMQVRLNTSDGVVKFVYKLNTLGSSTSYFPQVGIRTSTTDYNNRLVSTGTEDWATSLLGTANTNTCRFTSVSPAKSFTTGLTYTYTPPVACTSPVNQPTALVLTPLTTSVSGTFTAAAGSDSYLVVRTPDGVLTAPPVNGTTYTVGAALGNGIIVSTGGTTFTASSLTAGTLYYFHVFSKNALCSGGPLYLTTSPLIGSVTTAPNPPASMTATAISGAQIDLTTIANVAGDNIMIAWNTVNTFGTPTGTYNPGDPITGGGTVLNTAAAGTSNHTGLIQGTQYYYRAWSVAGGIYSSTTVSANAITLCSAAYGIPFTQNFDGAQEPEPCWTEANGQLLAPTTLTGTTSNWRENNWRGIVGTDKAAVLNIWSTGLYAWLFTPQIDLGTGTYQLEFDLSLNAYNSANPPATTGTDDKFAVVISTDGGTTWTSANTLRLWDNAGSANVYNNINPAGERIIISLAGYTGVIKIGFYGESTVSNADNDLSINNLAIVTPPSCSIPLGLVASSVTNNAASIGWTDATTVEIDYAVGAHTAGTGTIVPNVTANPYGLTGLTSNSTYYVYVRQNCGAGNLSAWAGPVIFTTLCDPTTAINENFDAATAPALPSCWSKYISPAFSFETVNTYTTAPNSAPNCVQLYSSGAALAIDAPLLISPQLSNLGAGTHQLKFYAKGASTNLSVIVGTMSDPTDAATFTPFQTVTGLNTSTWTSVIMSFAAYSGSDQYIAFAHPLTTTYSYVYIDDVVWETLPACPQPSTLTATTITGSSAVLGWNANGTTAWDIEWGTSGFVQGTGTTVTGVTNPYTLSGLAPTTAYSFYVRANCGAGGYSAWSGPVSFTTTVACPAPTALTVTAITSTQASLGFTNPGGTLWNIEWGLSGFVQGTGTVVSVSSNPYVLTGLTANTAYSWYVQQDCGGSQSSWAGPNTFTTLCDAITTLPWNEGFESVTIPALPSCWTKNGDYITTNNANSTYDADARTGAQFLRESYSATDEFAWSPGFTLTAGISYDYSFYWAGDTYAGWTGDVFYNSTPSATGATQMGASFVTDATVTTKTYAKVTRTIVPSATGTFYFAVRVNCPTSSPWYLSFDDFKLEVTPSCVEPTAIIASAVTASSATISWTAASPVPGSGYQWEVRTSGAGGSGATGLVQSGSTGAGIVTANVTGLASATTFSIYVRSNCGGTFSAWAGPTTFTTLCNAVTSFTENFDALTPPALPTCWAKIGAEGSSSTQTTGALSAPNCLYIYAASGTYGATVAMPIVSNAGANTNWLTFKLRANFTVGGIVQVGYMTDRNDPATFVLLQSFTTNSTTVYQNCTVAPGTAPGANQTLAFRMPATPGYSALIDDVVWEALPSCLPPTALTASAVTATTATISWTAPSPVPASGYQWEVRTSGAGGSGATGLAASGSTAAGVVTANVTGLTSATNYSIYVRSNCGGSFSTWAGPSAFATLCGTYNAPYSQNFDAVTTPAIPICWTIYSSAALRPWLTQSTTQQPGIGAHSEPNFAAIFYSATAAKDEWLVSPGINLTAGIAYRAKFFVNAPGYAGVPESMKLTVSTDPSLVGMAAGTVIWNNPSMFYTSWTELSAPFTPTTTGTYYFGWHGYSVADVDYIALDDITIELVPACDSPTAIVASVITENSATISWTASTSNPANGYEYEVRTSGAGGSGATGLVTSGSTAAGVTAANITGLTGATDYFVYVRSVCGAGDYSAWGSGSFSTACGVLPTPFIETVEVGELSPCWTVSGGTYNWAISSGASGYGVGSQSFIANFYSISDPTPFDLFSPTFDASTLTNPVLEFDYAYASYPGAVDQMDVYYSTDGGSSFTLLLSMPGGASGILNTAGEQTGSFVPTAGQWATQSLALPAGTNMIVFDALSDYGNNLYVDNVKIIEAPVVDKTLNLSGVMLEGLYAGGGTMNQANDDLGPKFGPGVADVITVELHNDADYYTIEQTYTGVELSTTGTATVTGIPSTVNGDYYITIRHRNSVETTTASPVSFAGDIINQSFALPANVYGGNLLLMLDMGYAIYGGDVTQDGYVDTGDVTEIDNDQFNFTVGYVASDVNGDGFTDTGDVTIVDNNQFNFVGAILP